VREREWLEARVLTFECDRQDFHCLPKCRIGGRE
jgi:hypothetical protein